MGPGPIWVPEPSRTWTHVGFGPKRARGPNGLRSKVGLGRSGPRPKWARAKVDPGPSGTGPKLARAKVGLGPSRPWVQAGACPKCN